MKAPIAYMYDRKTFEYKGKINRYPDPKTPGSFLRVSYSSDIPPHAAGKNQTNIFDREKNQWRLEDDYRGVTYFTDYNKTSVISELGQTPESLGGFRTNEEAFDALPEGVRKKIIKDNHKLSMEKKIKGYRWDIYYFTSEKAKSYGFNSIDTAVSYSNEPADPKNQSYGIALREWRSKCWLKGREMLAEFLSTGVDPGKEAILAAMPEIEFKDGYPGDQYK